jgi:putative hydrolase of the HAD superfamily
MKKNKLILFDWGGIVEDNSGWLSFFQLLFKDCGYEGKLEYSNFKDYKLSSLPTKEEFEMTYNEMKKDYNFNVDFDFFCRRYKELFDTSVYYQDVVDYEHSLRDKCYIGVLSNLAICDRERINKQLSLDKYDYVFLSYELACRKPDLEIYEKVQEQLPFDKKDILFIDDRTDNIIMAEKFGWNAFKATGLELDKIKEVCENFINN